MKEIEIGVQCFNTIAGVLMKENRPGKDGDGSSLLSIRFAILSIDVDIYQDIAVASLLEPASVQMPQLFAGLNIVGERGDNLRCQ